MRINPTDVEAAARLADCYAAQGRRGEAVRYYLDVAEAHERAGCARKSLDAYQKAADIDPANTSLLMALAEKWLLEGASQRAHACFVAAGEEFSRRGDDERALTAYLKARAIEPDERRTLSAIASICAARGQSDCAIPILCESLDRNSSDPELLRLLGSAYLTAGRMDEARRTFLNLMALDPDEYRSVVSVAERLLEVGELARAAEHLDGVIDVMIARRGEQEAVDFLHKVLERDPEHPEALRRLASILRRLGDDFNLISTLRTLAESAINRGDHSEAIEALRELCELEPYEERHRRELQALGVDENAIPIAFRPAHQSKFDFFTLEDDFGNKSLNEPAISHRLDLEKSVFQYRSDAWTGLRGKSPRFELVTNDDRRRCPRVSLHLPLIVISTAGGWREFTETVDVSEEGIRIRLAHPIPPMTTLSLALDATRWTQAFPQLKTEYATDAIVRHCRQGPGGTNMVGVELGSAF